MSQTASHWHNDPPAAPEEDIIAHGTVLQTGIHNGKIAMWLFLGSEIMFFTGLIWIILFAIVYLM